MFSTVSECCQALLFVVDRLRVRWFTGGSMSETITAEAASRALTVPESATIQTTGNDLEVTASTPTQMAECQHSVIAWMKNKIEAVKLEIKTAQDESTELRTSYEYAVKQKWKKDTLKKHWDLAEKRVAFQFKRLDYYHKLLTALENGYYIVPPMAMELFAIRTDRKKPSQIIHWAYHSNQHNYEESAKSLPVGEGDNKNPHPSVNRVWSKGEIKDKDQQPYYPYRASEWSEIDFPFNMAKPHIMEATSRAMALKVFDEMGVLPQDYKRNPDPVIMGRIYAPKKNPYDNKCITFMIAWHLNTKDL